MGQKSMWLTNLKYLIYYLFLYRKSWLTSGSESSYKKVPVAEMDYPRP